MYLLLISASPNKKKSTSFSGKRNVKRPSMPDRRRRWYILKIKGSEFCEQKDGLSQGNNGMFQKRWCPRHHGKMLKADGIIFATRITWITFSAPMKALFDRTSHFTHCKRLLGKYTAGIVTSGRRAWPDPLDYLKYYSNSGALIRRRYVNGRRQKRGEIPARPAALEHLW